MTRVIQTCSKCATMQPISKRFPYYGQQVYRTDCLGAWVTYYIPQKTIGIGREGRRGDISKAVTSLWIQKILNLLNKLLYIFQCMVKIFWVEFQKLPLKFHTKYLAQTLKDIIVVQYWKFKSFQTYKLVCIFETPPRKGNADTSKSTSSQG